MSPLVLSSLILALLFSGCGDDDDDDAVVATASGKCDITTNPSAPTDGYSFCHLFRNWPQSDITQAKTDCESSNELGGAGTWSDITAATDGCSEVGKLGDCTWSATHQIVTTYSNVPSSDTADSHCSSAWSGTWSASS